MDGSRAMPRLYFLITAALTLCGVTARTVSVFTRYNEASGGYFDAGFFPALGKSLYFAVVILAIIGAYLIPKGTLPTELHIPHRAFVAWPLGCAMAIFTVLLFVSAYADLFTKAGTFKTALTLLGLLGSSYFFLSATRTGRYPDWLTAAGFLPILWCMVGIAETYTDQMVTMNSPIKIGLQMGFMGFMLIMISELRFRLGKAAPRAAMALLSIGTFLTLNAAIPVLVGSTILHNVLHSLYAAVLLFAGIYGGYILLRYTAACQSPADTDTVKTVSAKTTTTD